MAYKKWTASAEQLKPDPRYASKLASKFINCLMWDGQKSVAQRLFYRALDIIKERVNDASPLEVFENAIANVKPSIEVRSRRVGGSNYQVPMQIQPKRQQALAFRWIIQAVRGKSGRPTAMSLAEELTAAYRKEGAAVTSRENMHRMAEANRAFAHFAWR
ncbi:MAG: 30S ribosomal protein S7 [Phycisphaerae bacterium]|nr:30S ribosomal protein S7 [Phycisphaerae bacterium]